MRDMPRWKSYVVLWQLPSYMHVVYVRCWEVIMREQYRKSRTYSLKSEMSSLGK